MPVESDMVPEVGEEVPTLLQDPTRPVSVTVRVLYWAHTDGKEAGFAVCRGV